MDAGSEKVEVNNYPHNHGDGSFPLAALAMGGGGMGGIGGNGMVGGLLLGALLRNGRGGFLGGEGGDGCGPAIALTSKLGDIQGEICEAAGNVNQTLGALALGIQQAFAVTNTAIATVSREVCEVGCSIKEAVFTDGERTRALITANFNTERSEKINELNARVIELQHAHRSAGHAREVEVNVTQQVNQQQAQVQMQRQFDDIRSCLSHFANDLQVIRATNQAINIGGTQLANPTNNNNNVRA
jgi:hypothetical protein